MTNPGPTAEGLSLEEALHGLEWQAEHGVLATGRYRMKFVQWGKGEPVVFVHGLGDNLESFSLVMARLQQGFRCIAYTQPFGGEDGARISRYHLDDLVQDLVALLDHLGLTSTNVVGHSFGTNTVLKALHQAGDRFERAVLSNGFARRPLVRGEWLLAQLGRVLPGRMHHLPFREAMLRHAHYRIFARCPPELWQFYLRHTGEAPIRGEAHWARVLHRTDLRPILPEIQHPVLIISGDQDTLTPPHHQDYLFRHLPNSVMFQIPNCGHYPNLTHPDAMVDAIRRFLYAPPCAFEPATHLATPSQSSLR